MSSKGYAWGDLLSLSVITLYFVPVWRYIRYDNVHELRGLLGLFLCMCLNETIKHEVIGERSPRPARASDCNLWCNDGKQGGKPGMPSGHSAQVSFFVGYYAPMITTSLYRILLIMYAIIVMITRYTKECHTLSQILSGAALGLLFSVLVRP